MTCDLEHRIRELETENKILRETNDRLEKDLENSDAIRGAMVAAVSGSAEITRKSIARLEVAEKVAVAAAYYLHALKLAGKDQAITDPDGQPWTCEDAALRALVDTVSAWEKIKPT